MFTDMDGTLQKVCWRENCQLEYKKDKKRIEVRDRIKFRMKHQCYFVDIYGRCKVSSIDGEDLCLNHLIRRCIECGLQATKVCLYKGYIECKQNLCDLHVHSHKNNF